MVHAAAGLGLRKRSPNAFKTTCLPRESKGHHLGLLDSHAASGAAPNARGLDPAAIPTR